MDLNAGWGCHNHNGHFQCGGSWMDADADAGRDLDWDPDCGGN